MRPNRVVLAYLTALGVALTGTLALASLAVLLRIGTLLVGRPVGSVDGWLVGTAIVSLGIMPWPAIVALARALLVPGRLDAFRVESRPVGTAAVALVAFNEEDAIEQTVRSFASAPGVGAVIVADNGSSDQTRAIAAASGARVVQEERRGYGYACIRALKAGLRSGQPIVILCEADHTFRAGDIEKLTAYLKHADMVIGSRTHGALLSGDSQLNSFFALGNVFIAKLLQFRYWDWKMGGRLRLTDVGCTYRAIRAEALAQILPALEVGGSHFGPHMVMAALEYGLRVVEVPVTFWKRIGVSKGGNASWRDGFRLGLAMIWHILTYRVQPVSDHAGLPPAVPDAQAGTPSPAGFPALRVLFMATRDGHHPDAAGGDIQSWEYARYLASV
ncbi:MAG: glycosyltransferase family 2 protein, partial [bacterium]